MSTCLQTPRFCVEANGLFIVEEAGIGFAIKERANDDRDVSIGNRKQ